MSSREVTTDQYTLVVLYIDIIKGNIGTVMGYIVL